MSNDKQKFILLFELLSNAAAFVLMHNIGQWRHIVCCYDSSYAGYPATFVSAPKESFKILNCLKNLFENKKNCILLHNIILHMLKWGGSPLYPIFELQRI